ncbi:ComF family protein [Vogesella sp. LIG4]|uniref:ComF family protein n=1 Tax=Vogesella sp. LIG4 TaxID=1192162 RepID=UPI00082016BE|nr:ComF family protein [Vogesella sp. LIG4]SCK11104.1 comF family protein [Vogesella sp. LIG4]
MLSNLLDGLINNCPFFEQHCLLCGQRPTRHGLCQACQHALPWQHSARCPQCQAAVASGAAPCGDCQRLQPAFDRLLAAYDYDYPLDGMISRCKYGPQPALQGALAQLMLTLPQRHADLAVPDLIVPVPLAAAKLAQRGFNLPAALAAPLAATMRAPLSGELCWRKRNTAPQAGLNRAERLANLRDAFGVKHRCDGLYIAIVDDVASTGATLHALAKSLKKSGAKRVEAWVLARAHFRHT